MDTQELMRVARLVAHHVVRRPGQTIGAVRRRLPNRDRALIVEAVAMAAVRQWVVVDDDERLQPGPSVPAQSGDLRRTSYLAQVQQAMARLNSAPDA